MVLGVAGFVASGFLVDDHPTSSGSGERSGGGAGAEALALELLGAINSGDEDTAIDMLCPGDSSREADITAAITDNASLEIDPTTVDTRDGGVHDFQASLIGTVDGEPITSGHVRVDPLGETGWCVDAFDAG